MNIEQNEIFTTGRHKELDSDKFWNIIEDIQGFAELAKYSETAYYRLMNIMITAKREFEYIKD
jgi:DNA-binding SARP family transcriptional activator